MPRLKILFKGLVIYILIISIISVCGGPRVYIEDLPHIERKFSEKAVVIIPSEFNNKVVYVPRKVYPYACGMPQIGSHLEQVAIKHSEILTKASKRVFKKYLESVEVTYSLSRLEDIMESDIILSSKYAFVIGTLQKVSEIENRTGKYSTKIKVYFIKAGQNLGSIDDPLKILISDFFEVESGMDYPRVFFSDGYLGIDSLDVKNSIYGAYSEILPELIEYLSKNNN